jgi:hypothetical protein
MNNDDSFYFSGVSSIKNPAACAGASGAGSCSLAVGLCFPICAFGFETFLGFAAR